MQSAPVCHAELMFVDINTGGTITLGDTDLAIAETNITFDSQLLTLNRWYRVMVSASNIGGNAMSTEIISKLRYNIQNAYDRYTLQVLMM